MSLFAQPPKPSPVTATPTSGPAAPPAAAPRPVRAPEPLPRASDTSPNRHSLGAYRVRPLDF
ncbi:MAG: hypothetical protein PHE83_18055 [Opitutaceae bacterium]|nr:hypothetical protein [Opitutaceae bacterium]